MLKAKILMAAIALLISAPAYAIKTVASFYPVYLIAKNVAGDSAEVKLLVPPGTEMHEFSIKPRDMLTLQKANLIFLNGAGLEASIMKAIDLSKAVDAAIGIKIVGGDPHIWLDPLHAAVQAENIKNALSKLDPANKNIYERNAASFIKKMEALHRETSDSLIKSGIRYLITYHESFGYFARRYGLSYLSLTGPEAESPLPGRMKTVYDTVKREKVNAVFGEKNYDPAAIERLKSDLGVEVCTIDPIEGGPLEAGRYEEAMRGNIKTIIGCLSR